MAVWRRGRGIPGRKAHARWRGSAVVLGPVRGNYWVAMPGVVIKASPEQLRHATYEEKLAAEVVQPELRALAKEFMGGQGPQRGFMDIAADERPPGAEAAGPPAGPPAAEPTAPESPAAPREEEPQGQTGSVEAAADSESSPTPEGASEPPQDVKGAEEKEVSHRISGKRPVTPADERIPKAPRVEIEEPLPSPKAKLRTCSAFCWRAS